MEAIWSDEKFSILMLAGGDARLAPQGKAAKAAKPPRPPSSPETPNPAASAVGSGLTRLSPTSRGRSPAARWATLPYPDGQGALPVCVFDAVCPADKGAAEWRAGSWRVAGESEGSKRFAHQGNFPARRGTGTSRVAPPGTEIRALPQTERALPPGDPFRRIRCGVLQARLTDITFRGEHPAHAPNTGFPRPQTPNISPFPSRLIPKPSRRETGGLCPHPPKDQLRLSLQVQQKGKDRTSQGPVLEWR